MAYHKNADHTRLANLILYNMWCSGVSRKSMARYYGVSLGRIGQRIDSGKHSSNHFRAVHNEHMDAWMLDPIFKHLITLDFKTLFTELKG